MPTIGRRTLLRTTTTTLLAVSLMPVPRRAALAARTPAASDAYLYFIWPQDGTRIRGPFWCRFGLRGMGVTHAGDATPNLGHHHLFVDVDEPLDVELPISSDRKHLHFGAGQTETRLELPPGPHTLQLVLGDSEHTSFDPPVVSRKVHIVVV